MYLNRLTEQYFHVVKESQGIRVLVVYVLVMDFVQFATNEPTGNGGRYAARKPCDIHFAPPFFGVAFDSAKRAKHFRIEAQFPSRRKRGFLRWSHPIGQSHLLQCSINAA